jgi:L-ascorbate metabolism protein UlaG (beta-lactamase superfamily)
MHRLLKIVTRRWALAALGAPTLVLGGLMFESSISQATTLRCDRRSSATDSPQFANNVFSNPNPPRDDLVKATRKWLRGAPNREPAGAVPTLRPEGHEFSAADHELGVTWLGHSTVLLEIGGKRVLTDPVWSDRASPFKAFGPERFFEPPLAFDELPELDVVLISHDHYDHLDRDTVVALARREIPFVVPLGVGARMRAWGIDEALITELDWWQETTIDGLRLVCTPARHFSGRGLLDRNRTLWAGWAIIGSDKKVFFSGDSGFSPHFAEIGRRLGPFDLTMMEIGAYDSAWADVHMGPEQAVAAHHLVGGRLMLPIHWATFNLALHGWTEPGERALAEAQRTGALVAVPRPGERFNMSEPPMPEQWWPSLPWLSARLAPIVSSRPESSFPILRHESSPALPY